MIFFGQRNKTKGNLPEGSLSFVSDAAVLLSQPHLFDQRLGLRFVAAEAYVQLHRMLRTAFRKDVLTERSGYLAVEDALLLEKRESVGFQHLGPLVAVIAGSVTA